MQAGSTCECRWDIVRAGSGVDTRVYEFRFVVVGQMIPLIMQKSCSVRIFM